MSHRGPSLSHLCGGRKAPEQVGKPLTLKITALSRELWPAVSLKASFLVLLNKNLLQIVCVESCGPKVSAHSEDRFSTAEVFAGFWALPGVEHLREKPGCSPGTGGFSQTLCACFKTGRGNVVRSKVCYSNCTPQEPLHRYLFCFL